MNQFSTCLAGAPRESRTDRASLYSKSKEDKMEPHCPRDGDVLVSKPTAIVEHEICVVPRPPHVTSANHERAVAEGRQLAARLKVDAWLTEDNCHFIRIATYRQ
jgi:hypothetical protein